MTGDRAFASKDANGGWVYTLCKCCGDGGSGGGSGCEGNGWNFLAPEQFLPQVGDWSATQSYTRNVCDLSESTTTVTIRINNHTNADITLGSFNKIRFQFQCLSEAIRDTMTFISISDGGFGFANTSVVGPWIREVWWSTGTIPANRFTTRTVEVTCDGLPGQFGNPNFDSRAGMGSDAFSPVWNLGPISTIAVLGNGTCS